MIAVHLTDQLDDRGRLAGRARVAPHRLGCEATWWQTYFTAFNSLDLPGIFARSLEEAGPQLREKNRLDPAMATLLDNIELLATA